jgi:tellurite resistance protein TehA-like permease
MKKPFYQLEQTGDVIRQFTPNWFTMTMGTGVVALILPEFPFASDFLWQQLFCGSLTRYCLLYLSYCMFYAGSSILKKRSRFSHPAMALFLGAIPMGLATILNGFLKYGIAIYGDVAFQIAQLLWYVDVVLAVGIGVLVPFCMFHKQDHQLHTMTAMWLLPIVACEVAATSGGLLLAHMHASQQAVAILFASYMLWGMSVLPAFGILTILMLRLAVHQLPSKELAITSWLALGPIGTGALALLVLGAQAPQVLALIQLENLGVFFQNAGIVASFILLGFGVWWVAIAVLTTLKHAATELPFNLGWWG